MPRKMVLLRAESTSPVLLSESEASNELQLQEMMKANPDLLPVDEFGMSSPLMVVGRETGLPSGAVDLVAIARSGELLVVEFKTGPANPDFRAVVAQLVDYGSDLWGMTFEQFEQTVVAQYFASSHCSSPDLKGMTSLETAACLTWDLSEEEQAAFRDAVSRQLKTGGFHYVAVAQRFTPTVLRTVEYLNASLQHARFYAVEMVRFSGDGVSAFESRTLFKPKPAGSAGEKKIAASIDESRFLEAVPEGPYRQALSDFLEFCAGQSLIIYWGTVGLSVRLDTGDGKPISIGWLFPPGTAGWMGLSDATFGFDPSSLTYHPNLERGLKAYVDELSQVRMAEVVTKGKLTARTFTPEAFVQSSRQISAAISRLVTSMSQGEAQ